MKKLALALSVLATMSSPAMAVEGNAEAGQAKSALCAACHGPDGNSMIDMYPKIAGQHANYLAKQLTDFQAAMKTGGKEGRMDPVMGGMTMTLTEQDIADLAAFYASQTQSTVDVADVPALGASLYKTGDAARGITACIACHGPDGNGTEAAGFPKVSGQHANYLKIQLTKFRDTNRNNDLNGMMQDVSKKLSDADIEALSKYISSIK
ncbi:cytochrome c4 [Shewanella sp. WXL01]|uniref:Cytochrome c4 n=1 Tax=Shewanella maritima TaxID=2520507 RepID=A0A411PIG7_9GAMM|nr:MULTISPECIES: c-type cytochrome [Shewanella]NKF52064.1 cytochrome c4 [Shewanella sp. WXL01]QBF83140.1 cytochrome c4 [Shewanella maritima]